ncbi:hypothetical protein MNBD_GAMMA04-1990, partial [hydrothermal vent metagenome]
MSNSVHLFKPKNTTASHAVSLLILSSFSVQINAADGVISQAQRCLPALIAPLQLSTQPFTKKSQALAADLSTPKKHLEADQLSQPTPNQYLFTGNTKFTQPNLVVLSDWMLFDKGLQKSKFQGHVELHQPEILLTAEQVELSETEQTAVLNEAQYQILPSRMYGQASQIKLNQQAETAQ